MTVCTKTNHCTAAGKCGLCDSTGTTEVCPNEYTCNATGQCLPNQCQVSTEDTDCPSLTDYCDQYNQCSHKSCSADTDCSRTEHCANNFCAMCSATSACTQDDYSCENSTGICLNQPSCTDDAACAYNKTCNGTTGFCEIESCSADSDCRSLLCDTAN